MAMSSTISASVRQQFRQFRAALAVLGELELRPEQLRVRIDERGAIALEQIGRRQRAVELGELRLVVEQLQMARRAGHEEEDDALGLRREVRLLRRERIVCRGVEQLAAARSRPGRRRTARRTSGAQMCFRMSYTWSLFLGDRFVEVQQHARDRGPRRKLSGRDASSAAPAAASGWPRPGPTGLASLRRIAASAFASSASRLSRFCRPSACAARQRRKRIGQALCVRRCRLPQRSAAPGRAPIRGKRLVQRRQRLQRRVRARAADAGRRRRWARRRSAARDTAPSGSGTCRARGDSDPRPSLPSRSSGRSWPAAGTGTPARAEDARAADLADSAGRWPRARCRARSRPRRGTAARAPAAGCTGSRV